MTLTLDPAGLSEDQLERFPALAGSVALSTGLDDATVRALLTGQLLVTQAAADGTLSAATGVQMPGVLDDLYADAAADRVLGASWRKGVPSLALWAPTAQHVDLLVWPTTNGTIDTSGDPQRVAATRQDDGSWTALGHHGVEGRRLPLGGHGLRADHGRGRGQPGHRPVLGRAHARTRPTRCSSTWPTRRFRPSGWERAKPAGGRPGRPDDLRAARARLLDPRRDRARRPIAAPTSRSPCGRARAASTCASWPTPA